MNAVGAIRQIIINALGEGDFAVYPVILPQQKPYPAVTLRISDTKTNDTKTTISPIDNVIVTASIFAKTYNEAQDIETQIRQAIDGFTGIVVTTLDSVSHRFDEIRFLGRKDDFDEESVLFVRLADYDVRYYWQS